MLYWAGHARYVALGYLISGLFFFFVNRKQLMFVCIGCCSFICLYYLETAPKTPESIIYHQETDPCPEHHPGNENTSNNEYPQKNLEL